MMVKKGYGFRFSSETFCDKYGELRDAYETAQSYIFSNDIPEEEALELIYSIVKEDLREEEIPYGMYLEDWYNDDYKDDEGPLSPLEYFKSLLNGYDIGTVDHTLNS
jgi:hypothetical protein